MFLDATTRRNPDLISAAVALHQAGRIPSNCYVIDRDTVARNAAGLAALASRHGLVLYQMTKQFGRNPVIADAVARSGIPQVVAVDMEEARLLRAAGMEIGHLGHLVQVPTHEVTTAVAMRPEVVTVFGYEKAEQIAQAAAEAERPVRLLLRVVGPDDVFYPGQRGGIPVDDVVPTAQRIESLDGVKVTGVTSFPCLLWDEASKELTPTPNLATVAIAAERLRAAGIDASVVNAPSATCSAVLAMLAERGATHVEPGSSLVGQTPLHAVSDQPEVPAMVYVSEVTHLDGDIAYALGGGLYPRSRAQHALVHPRHGGDPIRAGVHLEPAETIDYYGTLQLPPGSSRPRVGDTVVYAFRAQVFTSRAFVAVVAGVGETPEVLGIFDRNGYRLNADMLAATPERLR